MVRDSNRFPEDPDGWFGPRCFCGVWAVRAPLFLWRVGRPGPVVFVACGPSGPRCFCGVWARLWGHRGVWVRVRYGGSLLYIGHWVFKTFALFVAFLVF